jgi:hypothetical protein
MPEHLHYEDDDLFNPETHHESSDVNVRALIWFMVVFVIFAVVTHLMLWFLYKGFVRMERKGSEELTAVQKPSGINVPKSEPLLEPFPQEDGGVAPYANTPVTHLGDMRRDEEERLTTYGWVDKQKGIVRVPIEVGKQIALQRGFPVRPALQPLLQPASNGAPPNAGAGFSRPVDGMRIAPTPMDGLKPAPTPGGAQP